MAVIDRSTRTYQPTDLAGTGRRKFINEARAGVARLRDGDGTSLSMVQTSALDVLAQGRNMTLAYLALENALTRPREHRRITDFGELGWAETLDDDDLAELVQELRDGLSRAIVAGSFTELDDTLNAWGATARLLALPDAAERLRTDDDEDWDGLPRPETTTEQ